MKRKTGSKIADHVGTDTSFGFAALSPEQQRVFAAWIAADPRFKILYIIPHGEQDLAAASPFGWYTEGLHEAAGPIQLAATLPADIREPYTPLHFVLRMRLSRLIWPMIIPIQLDALTVGLPHFASRFQIFLTTNVQMATAVDAVIENSTIPRLHISQVAGRGRISPQGADLPRIDKYVRDVLHTLSGIPEEALFARQARQAIQGTQRRRARIISLPQGGHNIVTPNELALISFGRKLHKYVAISRPVEKVERDPQRYISRVCLAADAVAKERESLMLDLHPGIIDQRFMIVLPAFHWRFYQKQRSTLSDATAEERKMLRQSVKAFLHAETYSDAPVHMDGNQTAAARFLLTTMKMRSDDMQSFTAGLSMIACATLVPVLRLEPKLNKIRGELKVFANCVRGEGVHHRDWKESRLLRRLGSKMRALIAPEFVARLDAQAPHGLVEGLKLVSDLPLELLPIRGLPVSLRFDVSRIPPVPGNLFIQNCLRPPITVPFAAFEEILVVRSFEASDPLKLLLEHAIDSISGDSTKRRVKYRFVDVSTPDEFANAVNGFRGAIMVFDGHGTHDAELGTGSLVVGDEPLDMWALRGKCTLPPIVMLSACDTLPIDGSHSSVANAVFTLGAHSTLATMFPIDGVKAAVFNGRFLLRLEEFLPAAIKTSPRLNWREVVSGMLRMSHCTDLLLGMEKRLALDLEDRNKVQMAANMAINARRSDWYEAFLIELSKQSSWTVEALRKEILDHFGLTDAMKYIQIGSPENITIVDEAHRKGIEKMSEVTN